MLRQVIILFILVIFSFSLRAGEKSYAFIVDMMGDYVKVLSPSEYTEQTTVIIQNKTLNKIYGKVVGHTGRTIANFAVWPSKVKTVDLKLEKGEKAFVVPLSPAFQSFELKFGSQSYEIPPKK